MFSYRIDEEIELRVLEMRHSSLLFRIIDGDRARLGRWLNWVDDTKSEHDTARFVSMALDEFAHGDGLHTGIWVCDEFAGVISLYDLRTRVRSSKIGYWLVAQFEGRGVMTRACRAIVDYAFDELLLHRVEIQCATGNRRSCAVPRRLGFVHEGTIRCADLLHGIFIDHHVFGMLTSDWPPRAHRSAIREASGELNEHIPREESER